MSMDEIRVEDYLKELEVPNPKIQLMIASIRKAILVYGSQIDKEHFVFLEDRINKDGERYYDALNIITKSHVVSMIQYKEDLTEEYSIVPIANKILAIQTSVIEYDFSQNTDSKSRMKIEVRFNGGNSLYLTAVKSNCKHLNFVLQEYLIPNLE